MAFSNARTSSAGFEKCALVCCPKAAPASAAISRKLRSIRLNIVRTFPYIVGRTPWSARVPRTRPFIQTRGADEGVGCGPGVRPTQSGFRERGLYPLGSEWDGAQPDARRIENRIRQRRGDGSAGRLTGAVRGLLRPVDQR